MRLTIIATILILAATPAHAGWRDRRDELWENLLQKIAPQNPTQFEECHNDELFDLYCYYGARSVWGSKKERQILGFVGNQLRFNHQWGNHLTANQLQTIKCFEQFEGEL